jgi:hypothetical protein
MNEQQRLVAYTQGEAAPSAAVVIDIQHLADPAACLAKLVAIMQGVLAVPDELWDEEAAEQWEAYLPKWFVAGMKQLTLAQILATPGQWDYESWGRFALLSAMGMVELRSRGHLLNDHARPVGTAVCGGPLLLRHQSQLPCRLHYTGHRELLSCFYHT